MFHGHETALTSCHGDENDSEMTMTILQDLSTKSLPAWVFGYASVDAIQILEMAGHIKTSLSPNVGAPLGKQFSTRVLEITSQGYRMLQHFPVTPMSAALVKA